ncbi:hypothetical protein BV25DRAFT_1818619, partial [Artomyces pyxidatus]
MTSRTQRHLPEFLRASSAISLSELELAAFIFATAVSASASYGYWCESNHLM